MKEQLTFEKTTYHACVFTGHRNLKSDFSAEEVKKAILTRIEQGVMVFYNGMATGFDLASADELLKLKKDYPIKLVACVPYPKQASKYSPKEKAKYAEILSKADEVVTLGEHYYNGCFLARNDYMIERADCMIAYLNEEKGGTAYTVKKFRKKRGEHIIFVNDKD